MWDECGGLMYGIGVIVCADGGSSVCDGVMEVVVV